MRKYLLGLLFVCASVQAQIVTIPIPGGSGLSITVGVGVNALPLRDIRTNPAAVNITQGDDNWAEVPLGFTFPFWNRTFTTSWAMTNGMVTFQDPVASGIYGACCSGVNLATTSDPRWNYSIFAVHSDLYSFNSNSQYYLRENNAMTYGWYNVSQCCNSEGGNSFEIKITSSGTVDTRIAGARVSWNSVTSGMSGDLTKGEYYQYYHGEGLNIVPGSPAIFSWNTNGGFTGADPCIANPLSSPACPGYQQAYITQQCTISALYDPSCPGYQLANYNLQCSLNPLYDSQCPGYATAYFNQQCSLNSLYDSQCPGYATAYFNQQCSLNALYDSQCPGYATAYFNQQCSLNALYDKTCPGYATAYFNQQCSLNSLYDRTCPGYNTAYVTEQVLTSQQKAEPVTQSVSQPIQQVEKPVVSAVSPAPIVAIVQAPTVPSASPGSIGIVQQPVVQPQVPQQSQTQQQPTTVRQKLQQARIEASRKQAASKSNESMKEAAGAKTIEQQVAAQNSIIAALGYNPQFDAYSSVIIADRIFYKSLEIYKRKENIDNSRALRGLYGASDIRHQQLTDQQYK